MKLVVDDAIPWAEAAFGGFGELVRLPGRAIDAAACQDADALVVRTVTRVDAALLAGTSVRFVGTATAGIDHVDVAWLRTQGLEFASAAGCNATAVAEYVLTVLHLHALERDPEALHGPVGVVGLG
ncbi:MAG: 4-phosphoerythronate dehydrogenase, partial [Deltaproteobacteria bacterium]|nr:4-phosphoerythronate dehydrogenase [Nannocystaceae bacterium]